MYLSTYLERLKLKLTVLKVGESYEEQDGSKVLNAVADLEMGEEARTTKPIGAWGLMTVSPYDEFCLWCQQHGIDAYLHDHGCELYFVRRHRTPTGIDALIEQMRTSDETGSQMTLLTRLLARMQIFAREVVAAGAENGPKLADVIILLVVLADSLGLDLPSEIFRRLVERRLHHFDVKLFRKS